MLLSLDVVKSAIRSSMLRNNVWIVLLLVVSHELPLRAGANRAKLFSTLSITLIIEYSH